MAFAIGKMNKFYGCDIRKKYSACVGRNTSRDVNVIDNWIDWKYLTILESNIWT